MRRIDQPGPASPDRLVAVPCHGLRLPATLVAGLPLLEAVRRSFAAAGFVSGVLTLDGLKLDSFAYVMPALSKTPEHAAFYSETFAPLGIATIETGRMTFGERDGAPFFHAHALWHDGTGARGGGHILPDGPVIAEEITLDAVGLDGAAFVAEADPETNFKLFAPQPAEPLGATRQGRFFALRVKPNADFADTLEGFCAESGIERAIIHGGVGSTIGASFTDGSMVENFATEVAITGGRVEAGGSQIDAALVDYRGGLAGGRLKRGDNPVLMTFELVLEVV